MNNFTVPHSTANTSQPGLNLKQTFRIATYTQLNDMGHYDWRSRTEDEVLVGLNKGKLRIRYPDGAHSKVQRLNGATDDLKKLAALTICELIPIGIFADALEESHPEHREAADILRRWWDVKQGAQP